MNNKNEIIFIEKPKNKNFQDLENQKFNRWLIIGYAGKFGNNKKQPHYWWCKCDCGNICKIQSGALKNNASKSCGCLKNEKSAERLFKHGKSNSKENKAYHLAKSRCNNPNSPDYKDYGERGIKFLFNSFEEFYSELGDKPEPKHLYSIERIDNNGNYELGNCKWALIEEQSRNTRQNHWIIYKGETKCLKDWSNYFNLNIGTVSHRLTLGWCLDCSFNIKVKEGVCQHKKQKYE